MFKEGFGNVVKSSFGCGMILRNTLFLIISMFFLVKKCLARQIIK